MRVTTCEVCGKVFFTKSHSKKYCSKSCQHAASKMRQEENRQLCWRCKNACGGCVWSKEFKPVIGWTAEETIIKDTLGDFQSYRITKCPEFIRR